MLYVKMVFVIDARLYYLNSTGRFAKLHVMLELVFYCYLENDLYI